MVTGNKKLPLLINGNEMCLGSYRDFLCSWTSSIILRTYLLFKGASHYSYNIPRSSRTRVVSDHLTIVEVVENKGLNLGSHRQCHGF